MKATRITPGTKRRQMNRSIMSSASKFIAHRGQPRAVCASTLPQSRQVFVLISWKICYGPAYTLLYWSKKFILV